MQEPLTVTYIISSNPEDAKLITSKKYLKKWQKLFVINHEDLGLPQTKRPPSFTNLAKHKIKLSPRGSSQRKTWIHFKRQLIPCDLCVRSFVPERFTLDFQNHRRNLNQLKNSDQPNALVCAICGEDFDSEIIPFHEPNCLKNWIKINLSEAMSSPIRSPKAESLTPSRHRVSLEERNREAYLQAQAQMVPCHNCGRTFFPDRLVVHQRSCQPKGGISPSKGKIPSPGISSPKVATSLSHPIETESSPFFLRPRFLICYICGREFGSKSLPIHEPQCLKKWEIENANLPKSMRRPTPVKPAAMEHGGAKVKELFKYFEDALLKILHRRKRVPNL